MSLRGAKRRGNLNLSPLPPALSFRAQPRNLSKRHSCAGRNPSRNIIASTVEKNAPDTFNSPYDEPQLLLQPSQTFCYLFFTASINSAMRSSSLFIFRLMLGLCTITQAKTLTKPIQWLQQTTIAACIIWYLVWSV